MTITATKPANLLRFALTLDGVASGLSGVALLALAGVLDGPLGISSGALFGVGVFFVLYGAAVSFLGTRPEINRRGAVAVVVVNLVYVLDSVLLVAVDLVDLTTLGVVAVLGLAAAVAALAALQVQGLRQN